MTVFNIFDIDCWMERVSYFLFKMAFRLTRERNSYTGEDQCRFCTHGTLGIDGTAHDGECPIEYFFYYSKDLYE